MTELEKLRRAQKPLTEEDKQLRVDLGLLYAEAPQVLIDEILPDLLCYKLKYDGTVKA